jgi:iron complex outermembrane recepter protein
VWREAVARVRSAGCRWGGLLLAMGVWPVQADQAGLPPATPQITIQAPRPAAAGSEWDAGANPDELPQTRFRVEAGEWSSVAARRVEDLAGLVPGLQVDTASAGLSSAVKLRGFGVTRLHYNGQPDVQRLFWRDPATVERVEVLVGPAGLSHGVASPGGVLHYIGKQPRFERQQVLRLGLDEHAVADAMLDLTGPLAPAWAYRLVVSARDGTQPPAALPQRHRNVLGALSWAYGRSGLLTLETEHLRNRTPYVFGTVITGGGTPDAQPQFDRLYVLPGGAPTRRSMQRWALDWRHRLDSGMELAARWSHAGVTRDETLLGFWALESDSELSGYYTRYRDEHAQSAFTLRAEGRVDWGPVRHHLAAGVDRYRQAFLLTGEQAIAGFTLDVAAPDFSGVDTAALDALPRYSREDQRDRAVWASDRIRLSESWQLTTGWRRTHYRIASDRSGAGLKVQADQRGDAWHLGASWRLAPPWLAHAALATGFEPNRGSTRAGTYLPPQRQRQAEAGLRWRAPSGASASATVFHIRLGGLAMTDPADRTAVIAAGARVVRGLQLQAQATVAGMRVGGHLQTLSTRQVVRTSASLGDDFPGVAHRTAGLRLSGRGGGAARPLTWTLALSAVGPRAADASNTTELPGYGLAHLSAAWQLSPGRTLTAGVRNLFDKRHVEAVTALDDVYQGTRRLGWVRLEQVL